jgi:hypothetical protein
LYRQVAACANDLSENVRHKNSDENGGDDSADDSSIENSVVHEQSRYCECERMRQRRVP